MFKKIMKVSCLVSLMSLLLYLGGCDNSKNNKAPVKDNQTTYPVLTTAQMQEKLKTDNVLVVDTRSNDAFNGWVEEGVERGGHLPGATDFSAQWLQTDSKDAEKRIAAAMQEKGLDATKQIVLYDANGEDSRKVADYLSAKGISNISLYDVKQWAVDKALPLEHYPNYQLLVPASWIKDVLDKKNPQAYDGNPKVKVFQVGWGPKSDKMQPNYISGAFRMNTDDFEEGPIWNRLPDERLKASVQKYGITHDTLVVLYGVEGADLMAAFRMYAILKYMGVKDVRVLNGGFAKWQQAGYPADEQGAALQAVTDFGIEAPAGRAHIIDMPEAKALLADKTGSQMVDIRTLDEFLGKIPGYSDITAKGRIPGSFWGQAGTDTSNLNDYRNPDETMKNGVDIIKMWKQHGISADKKLSFYCGTGWRAAEVLAYAHVMGLDKVSLYDGGWYEWSADSGNPVESGEPKVVK